MEPKCCHSARHKPHWHIVHEYGGQPLVWLAMKRLQDAPWQRRDDAYGPRSTAGMAFLDACLLETRLGAADFFRGKIFSPVGEGELTTRIEGIKVFVAVLGQR